MDNFLLTAPLQLTTPEIIVNLILAIIVGFIVAIIYKRTHRGVSYSQSYVSSLVLITVITAVVIMVIGNSLARAFGLIGAFTIIRFRTAVKDTRDITFLFLALTLGIASGVGLHQIAILALFFAGGLIFFLDKINFGLIESHDYVLNFIIKADAKNSEPYRKLFEQHLKDNLLLNVRSRKSGKELELAFNISLKDPKKLNAFTSGLDKIKGISKVHLLSTTNDIEY
jgi:uncharacterized membrane protein YhiD involved in acid resistance